MMGETVYVVALILIILWIIGFFAFDVGIIIHLLLAFAVIIVLIKSLQRNKKGI